MVQEGKMGEKMKREGVKVRVGCDRAYSFLSELNLSFKGKLGEGIQCDMSSCTIYVSFNLVVFM